MAIPVGRGGDDVLDAAAACLAAQSPAVIAAVAAEKSRTLAEFRDIWVGEYEPVAHDTPGVGFWIASSTVRSPSGLNCYDIDHTMHARMTLDDASGEAVSFSDFARVMHIYAQVVQYTISRHLRGFAPSAGIIEVRLISATPEPLSEREGGGLEQTVDIQFSVIQRIARWEA